MEVDHLVLTDCAAYHLFHHMPGCYFVRLLIINTEQLSSSPKHLQCNNEFKHYVFLQNKEIQLQGS